MNQGSFRLRGGEELATYTWLPAGEPRAHVYLLHGFGEHAGRYTELAASLTGAGHALHAVDHRGHGRSTGRRAVVPSYHSVSDDFAEFLAGENVAPAKTVLMGHSMGGPAAAQLALGHEAAGLVLSSPYLEPAKPPPAALFAALGVIRRLAPGLVVEKLKSSDLSRQKVEADAYVADPLVHSGGVPAVSAHSLLMAGRDVLARAASLELPLLIMHGAADSIAGVEGSRRLLAAAGSRDKQLIEFPEARHEVMNDLDRGEFFSQLLDWLDARF